DSAAREGDGTRARPYPTIARALEAAAERSTMGTTATVAIAAGTYPEKLRLDKSVVLLGERVGSTKITGDVLVTEYAPVGIRDLTIDTSSKAVSALWIRKYARVYAE